MSTVYRLDGDNRIISVSADWDDFALENDGGDVLSDAVTGRSLFDYITGDAARMWMSALLGLVRVGGAELERPYRCDSPGLRRFMSMKIIPEGNGVLRLEHTVLRVERRTEELFFLSTGGSGPGILRRCSACGRVQSNGAWVEADSEENPPEGKKEMPVVYTICEVCWNMAGESGRESRKP